MRGEQGGRGQGLVVRGSAISTEAEVRSIDVIAQAMDISSVAGSASGPVSLKVGPGGRDAPLPSAVLSVLDLHGDESPGRDTVVC